MKRIAVRKSKWKRIQKGEQGKNNFYTVNYQLSQQTASTSELEKHNQQDISCVIYMHLCKSSILPTSTTAAAAFALNWYCRCGFHRNRSAQAAVLIVPERPHSALGVNHHGVVQSTSDVDERGPIGGLPGPAHNGTRPPALCNPTFQLIAAHSG
jgi:hypothetical protein